MSRLSVASLASSALANGVCPDCGSVYGPDVAVEKITWFKSRVTCPHCGAINDAVAHQLAPGASGTGLGLSWEERNNPTGPMEQPASSPIRLNVRGDRAVQVVMPARPKSRFQRIGQLLGMVVIMMVVVALPYTLLTRQGGLNIENPMTWLLLGVPLWVAFQMRRFHRREHLADTCEQQLLIDRSRLVMETTEPGRPPQRQTLPTADIRWVRRRLHQERRRSRHSRGSYAYIEIAAHGEAAQTLHFGDRLTGDEQRWLVWELRESLIRLGNLHVQIGGD